MISKTETIAVLCYGGVATIISLFYCPAGSFADVVPTSAEMALAERWMAATFENPQGVEPWFSFTYNGVPSAKLLPTWQIHKSSRWLDDHRTQHAIEYVDPTTKLTVRCVGVEYNDYPTVEWTLYFKNDGDQDTPILSDIQAVDVSLDPWLDGPERQLHHHVGSPHSQNDYQPLQTPLTPGVEKRLAAIGGRGTDGDWPYFNVASGDRGVIVVVGWPGQWAATFACDEQNRLRVRAGQELTHLKLLPGEEIRTPLIVLQFWQGDRVRSQNVWRRWMLAHNLPRPGGKLPTVQLAACSSHQYAEMFNADTENQKMFIDRYLDEGLKLDYWWMDAGWYPCDGVGWPKTGTWEVDMRRFPNGLREISDHAHDKDVKTIVWFEPERVYSGTWLADNHPEWLLNSGGMLLLNLGNPDAWNWLVEHVDGLINSQGIDLYRQDFNMDPLELWRHNDAEDRQGITENKHIVGYLAYWDELRRRHPDMLIDTCASGGKRNDLETLRRSAPLLRSDYLFEPVGNQCHTYGLASWLPYYGTGTGAIDSYLTRSAMCPHFTACFDMRRDDLNYDEARRLLGQWRQFAPCYLGDYYPLTGYSLANDAWMAWQFDRPEQGDGVVQAFRRKDSALDKIAVKLHDLEPDATYVLINLDDPKIMQMTGRELTEKGLSIVLKDRPGAAVIRYKKN